VTLPLLKRVADENVTFVMTPRLGVRPAAALALVDTAGAARSLAGRMPSRAPGPGEQYRFHFDMSACIGCKSCVVACNEQNGNPAAINWRRVGEVEGGFYPNAQRAYLSMGCNQCVNPTCMSGCPVDAYTKDPITGIVHHSAETCIGCQYCTWTCSYGVPQFNPERGVVGKCDMCHGRLSTGLAPACVSACPEGAIAIEIVNVEAWRAETAALAGSARAGATPSTLPRGDASLSTTRVTLPAMLPAAVRPLDIDRLKPGEAHTPLIVMTVLTQLAVGTLATIWLVGVSGGLASPTVGLFVALAVSGAALAAATLHLGRPIHAYRAMKMWRRSWLSREVVLFGAFSHVAGGYVAATWFGLPGAAIAGGLTTVLGLAGVFASGRIYLVPSRPAWNTWRTVAQFMLTAAVLGPLVTTAAGAATSGWLRGASIVGAVALIALVVSSFVEQRSSSSIELRGTARLLSTRFAKLFGVRLALLALCGLLLPLVSNSQAALGMAAVGVLTAELVGRYLFFVTAVPKHMTAPYLAAAPEAA